jgi:hypothetical protein
MDDRDINLYVQ